MAAALAGGAAFLGHLFPVWLGFKGGKGVATFFGILLAAAWPVGLPAGATWIAGGGAVPHLLAGGPDRRRRWPRSIVLLVTGRRAHRCGLRVFMAVLIFIRHHENIRRLLKGEEPRIGAAAERRPR